MLLVTAALAVGCMVAPRWAAFAALIAGTPVIVGSFLLPAFREACAIREAVRGEQ